MFGGRVIARVLDLVEDDSQAVFRHLPSGWLNEDKPAAIAASVLSNPTMAKSDPTARPASRAADSAPRPI